MRNRPDGTGIRLYGDATMERAVLTSNEVEGIPNSGLFLDNHLTAFKAVRTAAEEGEILHPRVLHAILFAGLDEIPELAGREPGLYRTRRVFIGDPFTNTVIFPDPRKVQEFMTKWWEAALDIVLPYEESRRWHFHAWFESIHPFSDGNGRVGRLLWWNMAMLDYASIDIIGKYAYDVYVKRLEQWSERNEYVSLASPEEAKLLWASRG